MKGKSKDEEKPVSLTIKVDEPSRRHWTAQAKAQKTTIRDAIIDCLTKKFGKPPKN